MTDFSACTSPSPACPVEATTYGYAPALWANATLLAIFAACCLAQLALAATTRVYSYSLAAGAGALLETVGYGGRLMQHANPWSQDGFRVQIVCLIIGPSFTAAAVYLTAKHVVRRDGPEYSPLRPDLYTWVFIGCDAGSIALQAIGGGLAGAAARDDTALLDAGSRVIIAGIAFQVVTMLACGVLMAVYAVRRRRGRGKRPAAVADQEPAGSAKATAFQYAVVFAYLAVLTRSIYRLPEMAGGWGNPRMRNETEFLVLDGLMVLLATLALTLAHPGFLYPVMRTTRTPKQDGSVEQQQIGEK